MDELRLIMLGVGVAIIALIYLWGMRARIKSRLEERRRRAAARSPENEPVLDSNQPLSDSNATEQQCGDFGTITTDHHLADQVLVDVEITPIERPTTQPLGSDRQEEGPGKAPELNQRPEQPSETNNLEEPQMTVLLTIIAPPEQRFQGSKILAATQELDLKFHESGVFDCFPEGQVDDRALFGVAHLREPGTFDLKTINTLATPGLLMFMHLPGPMEEVTSVDLMVAVARQLAEKLGGTVCDERRNKLTTQAIMRLRSEAAEFEKRLRSQQPFQ